MGRLLPLLLLADLALLVVAVIDCISTDDQEIRALPKLIWFLIILFFPPVGPIAWFIAGRPQSAEAVAPGHPGGHGGPGRAARPLAPDDDPEFLRKLSATAKQANEDRLRAWEDDLCRREEELRRRDGEEDEPNQEG
jgi:Phospholipase_D-nuclease N-terminal